jgi:hypothetical protein
MSSRLDDFGPWDHKGRRFQIDLDLEPLPPARCFRRSRSIRDSSTALQTVDAENAWAATYFVGSIRKYAHMPSPESFTQKPRKSAGELASAPALAQPRRESVDSSDYLAMASGPWAVVLGACAGPMAWRQSHLHSEAHANTIKKRERFPPRSRAFRPTDDRRAKTRP